MRTKTGNNGRVRRASLRVLLGTALGLSLPAFVLPVLSHSTLLAKDKPKKQQAAYAVIAGSVFREEGFSLPGAEVLVTPEKGKAQKHLSDARGEFAVRVPAVPMTFTVRVQKTGFVAQEKSVKVEGEGGYDVTFRLEAASKENLK